MNQYRIVYTCKDGYTDEVIIDAACRVMAFKIFETLGFEDVIKVDCYRVASKEKTDND